MDYQLIGLSEDPFENFKKWLHDAAGKGHPEPMAMTLATVSKQGWPRARIVLYKGLFESAKGTHAFGFFTNYESEKSIDLAENWRAALVFFWPHSGRQIRVEGLSERMNEEQSEAYFKTRARGSQIGAWVSRQGHPIPSRNDLLRRYEAAKLVFKSQSIPRPANLGGWLVAPDKFEFWQAGEHRLHDRFTYQRTGSSWKILRLEP